MIRVATSSINLFDSPSVLSAFAMAVRSKEGTWRLFCLVAVVLLSQLQAGVDGRALIACGGGKPADVVFLLDASNSIWNPDFRRQLDFVSAVVDWFPIGPDSIRVGVITYADYPQLAFHLSYYATKADVHAAIGAIRQTGGYQTGTADALRYMTDNVFGDPDASRNQVVKVGVVLTDGLSDNTTATAAEARRAKQAGVHMFAVGIGANVDVPELEAIASEPTDGYTFLVDDFAGLDSIRELLAIKACEVTDPPTTITTTTTATTSSSKSQRVKPDKGKGSDDDDTSLESDKTSPGSRHGDIGADLKPVGELKHRTPVVLVRPNFTPEEIFSDREKHGQSGLIGSNRSLHNDRSHSGKDSSEEGSSNGHDRSGGFVKKAQNKSSDNDEFTYIHGSGVNFTDGLTGNIFGFSNDSSGNGIPKAGYWVYDEQGRTYWFVHRGMSQEKLQTTNSSVENFKANNEDSANRQATGHTNTDKNGNQISGEGNPLGIYRLDERGELVWYRYISPGVYRNDNGTTVRIPSQLTASDANKSPNKQGNTEGAHSSKNITDGTTGESGPISEWGKNPESRPDEKVASNGSARHVYISSRPEGRGGYWRYDEQEGYVWYRYLNSGVFERDMNATIKYRESQLQRTEGELKASNHASQTTPAARGRWVSGEDGQFMWESNSEEDTKSSTEESTAQRSGKTRGVLGERGYWIYDAYGRRVRHQLYHSDHRDSSTTSKAHSTVRSFTGERDAAKSTASDDLSGSKLDAYSIADHNRKLISSTPTNSVSTEARKTGSEFFDENASGKIQFVTPASLRGSQEHGFWSYDKEKRVWFRLPVSGIEAQVQGNSLNNQSLAANARNNNSNLSHPILVRNESGADADGTVWSYNEQRRRIWFKPESSADLELFDPEADISEALARVNLTDKWPHWRNPFNKDAAKNTSAYPSRSVLVDSISKAIRSGRQLTQTVNESASFERSWVHNESGQSLEVYHKHNVSHGLLHSAPSDILNLGKSRGSTDPARLEDAGDESLEHFGSESWHIRIRPASENSPGVSEHISMNELQVTTAIREQVSPTKQRVEDNNVNGTRKNETKTKTKSETANKGPGRNRTNNATNDRKVFINETKRREKSRKSISPACIPAQPMSIVFMADYTADTTSDSTHDERSVWSLVLAILNGLNTSHVQSQLFLDLPSTFNLTSSGGVKLSPIKSTLDRLRDLHLNQDTKKALKTVLVYISNGPLTNFKEKKAVALELKKDARFQIFVVGMGKSASLKQLSALASAPARSHRKLLANESHLKTVALQVAKKLCLAK